MANCRLQCAIVFEFQTYIQSGRSGMRPWHYFGVLAGLGAAVVAAISMPWHALTRSGAARLRPNVVLISLDTTRADHLGCYGYPRPTSPNLDRLAARGVRYANARSQFP